MKIDKYMLIEDYLTSRRNDEKVNDYPIDVKYECFKVLGSFDNLNDVFIYLNQYIMSEFSLDKLRSTLDPSMKLIYRYVDDSSYNSGRFALIVEVIYQVNGDRPYKISDCYYYDISTVVFK